MSATEEYSKLYAQRPKFDPTRFDQATKKGRLLFQQEKDRVQNEATQWDKDNKSVLDALKNRMDVEGKSETQAQTQGADYQKYMSSPEHINYQIAKAGALAGSGIAGTGFNMLLGHPATQHTTRLGRAGIMAPYGLEALASLEAANKLGEQSPKAQDDPRGRDITDVAQNALYGFSTGPAITGLRKGLSTKIVPGEPNPTPPPINSAPQAPEAPPRTYEGRASDVVREIAADLGLKPGAKEKKADLVDRALEAIPNTHADRLTEVGAKMKGADPLAILKQLRNSTSPVKFGIGALGLGAAAAAMAPGKAEAAPSERAAPPTTRMPPPEETSSDLSDLEREYGTGLPKGMAREALKGAADTALTAVPVLGEARMALGAPYLYNPSDKDLEEAEDMQRYREEMAKPHEASGGAVNPEHLPEHERAHLDNPQAAHDKAAWMLPYLRAGAEAQKRGEDFFGGSPEYENQLAALKHFYHGKQAPTADEAPTAPEGGFKHGGAVNRKSNPHSKQMNSIHDTFKHKLADKERMIASLEKAVARKPNAKLAKRLSKEKSEAQRIHEHLQKIMTHAQ